MQDLLVAYLKYAEKLKFEAEILYSSDSSVSVKLDGKNVKETFKHEAGKHVVQRVPVTERNGRRHTSVVSVAVVEIGPEIKTELDMKEVEIMTQRSGGPGGQNVNKVESSVRVVHKPTGMTVRIDSRDQSENKILALEILAIRVSNKKREAAAEKLNSDRKDQLGGGNRSGKVRTYNFIDSYVADHRTGNRTAKIKQIMRGEFDLLKFKE